MARRPAAAPAEDPPDEHIEILRVLAESAGDEELVRLCGAASRNYANAREVIAREIAHGPLAEAFRAALRSSSPVSAPGT